MVKQFDSDDHIMIDIETLGKGLNPVIPQISAVSFNPISGEILSEFNVLISIQSCLDAGLKVDESTLKFWFRQNADAQNIVLNLDDTQIEYSLEDALTQFKGWCATVGRYPKVWGNGPTFDLAKMQAAYEAIGIKKPWDFYNERCCRTIVAFEPEFKKDLIFEGEKHNGIDDAKHQVRYISQTLNHILNVD